MSRRQRQYEDDDGRTICNMDVDGMPQSAFTGYRGRSARKADKQALKAKVDRGDALTRREYRRYTWYAVLGGLTVLGVVGGGTVLFIFILWLFWR